MSKRKMQNHVKQAVEVIFRKYDWNNSGFLEEKQILSMLSDTYASLDMELTVSEQMVQNYLRDLDTNGDRKLSREEVGNMVQTMLS